MKGTDVCAGSGTACTSTSGPTSGLGSKETSETRCPRAASRRTSCWWYTWLPAPRSTRPANTLTWYCTGRSLLNRSPGDMCHGRLQSRLGTRGAFEDRQQRLERSRPHQLAQVTRPSDAAPDRRGQPQQTDDVVGECVR